MGRCFVGVFLCFLKQSQQNLLKLLVRSNPFSPGVVLFQGRSGEGGLA